MIGVRSRFAAIGRCTRVEEEFGLGGGIDAEAAEHVSSRRSYFLGVRAMKSSAISSIVAQRIALVAVDVLDHPLEHQDHLRPAGDVRVDRHPEDRVVLLAVDVVELVAPDLLEVPRVDEAVAVRRALDEHHRREVVEVPARRDLDQVGLLAARRAASSTRPGLRVVDLRPRVSDPDVVGVEVACASGCGRT